ncbi:MAG: hypothetical protein LLG06_00650, partial [Desulfobacteraceae bacterium]|nr:hypothetical protein [Desulfobacteraceae bacterium]
MKEIRLYFAQARNIGDNSSSGRLIEFTILVRNLDYRKDVEVLWALNDGAWETRRADYLRSAGDNEVWRAKIRVPGNNGKSPGDRVHFALRYRAGGREYWDNNGGANYAIETDAGLVASERFSLIHLDHADRMERGRKTCAVRVALRASAGATRVGVVWSRNGWKSSHTSLCSLDRCSPFIISGATLLHGSTIWSVWTCELEVGDAFRVEYAIFADTPEGRIWDNNFGSNHHCRRHSLKVLTLNLHCYQEEDQDDKFRRIALAVSELDIDIVCFQEVGERWNGGAGDW